MSLTHRRTAIVAALGVALLAVAPVRSLAAQSLEGSKWSIDQEGVDVPVVWWLGSQGRVRTGDLGTILAGYKWKQDGDSVIVTIGDSVRYAGVLMANRLVGVRNGTHRQEGWWSGARADGAAAVASTSSTPSTPTVNPPAPTSTEPMSRPTDQPVNAPAPTSTQTPAPRTLRRIERAGDPPASQAAPTTTSAPASGSDAHEIRRLPRPGQSNAPATAAPAAPTPTAIDVTTLLGHWVHTNPNTGITLDLRADSTVTYVRRDAREQSGRWVIQGGEVIVKLDLIGGGTSEDVIVKLDGAQLTLQPRGGLLKLTLNRGPVLEPAVRQP